MTDFDLIEKIKQDADSDSLLELINRHSGIYNMMVDKFLSGNSNILDRNELIDEKNYIIYNSAIKFDASKNAKFPTYLANQTKWICLNKITKKNKNQELPLEEMLSEPYDEFTYDNMQNEEVLSLFKKYVDSECDEKSKNVIDMRYNTCNNKLVPWRIIAKKLEMSIQGVINIHNRCLDKFKSINNYV